MYQKIIKDHMLKHYFNCIIRCIYSILSSTSAEKQPDHRTLQTKTITIAKFETEEVVARLIEVLDYEDTMMIQESLVDRISFRLFIEF